MSTDALCLALLRPCNGWRKHVTASQKLSELLSTGTCTYIIFTYLYLLREYLIQVCFSALHFVCLVCRSVLSVFMPSQLCCNRGIMFYLVRPGFCSVPSVFLSLRKNAGRISMKFAGLPPTITFWRNWNRDKGAGCAIKFLRIENKAKQFSAQHHQTAFKRSIFWHSDLGTIASLTDYDTSSS